MIVSTLRLSYTYNIQSVPTTPTQESHDNENQKVPEIVQYFVKGEYQPPTTTYVVPTGQPPLHEGRSTHNAAHYAPESSHPYHHHHHHDSQQQSYRESAQSEGAGQQYHVPYSVPSDSFSVTEGPKTEAGQEQVSGPPQGAPVVHHEERGHKHELPPMEYSWDAQR